MIYQPFATTHISALHLDVHSCEFRLQGTALMIVMPCVAGNHQSQLDKLATQQDHRLKLNVILINKTEN